MGVELGQKVKCKVTGFAGVVTSVTEFINGCRQAGVQPPIGKDGKMADPWSIDEQQLEIVDSKSVLDKPKKAVGGPMMRAPRQP